MSLRFVVTPRVENQYVRIVVVLAVSVLATVHVFAVSIHRTVVTRWRSR